MSRHLHETQEFGDEAFDDPKFGEVPKDQKLQQLCDVINRFSMDDHSKAHWLTLFRHFRDDRDNSMSVLNKLDPKHRRIGSILALADSALKPNSLMDFEDMKKISQGDKEDIELAEEIAKAYLEDQREKITKATEAA